MVTYNVSEKLLGGRLRLFEHYAARMFITYSKTTLRVGIKAVVQKAEMCN